ncbi:MAG: O-antigen ligase family protein [Aquisalimonadaceae bacterium]
MTTSHVLKLTLSERIAPVIALIGLYGFCLSIGPSVAGVNVSAGLILLATVLAGRDFWQAVRPLPVFWLMAGFLAYLTVQSLVFIHYHPELNESGNPHWTHIARTAGLISLPMAWWIARFPRQMPWLLGVVGLSLALGILDAINVTGLIKDGISNRQYWGTIQGEVSYMAATGLIGCWLLAMRLFLVSRRDSWHFRLAAPLLALAGGLFLLALYGSQTRSTWGATALTLAVFGALEMVRAFKRRESLLPFGVLALVAVVTVTAVVTLDGGRAYEQRLGGQSKTLKAVMELDSEQIYEFNASLGIRVFLWEEGIRAVAARPVVGWGIGGMRRLNENLNDHLGRRAHFHNIYLELLVGVGVIGTLALGAIIYLLVRRALAVARRYPERRVVIQLALAGLLMTSLALLFEIRVGHTSGRSIMILLFAVLAVSFWYPPQVRRTAINDHHESVFPGRASLGQNV